MSVGQQGLAVVDTDAYCPENNWVLESVGQQGLAVVDT